MNDKENNSIKNYYIKTIKTQRENKNIYENVMHNSSFKGKINNQLNKIDKPTILNNQNNIKSINIINNNYNNIIINNKLTPNKKLLLNDKTFSINKKNYKILTLGNKQKNLNKGTALKLVLDNQEQENDFDYKYKLIINEKNNLINKLKDEVEYYKNRKLTQSPIITNNNSADNELKNKKNMEIKNLRNKIQNIFSHHKKEIKLDNNNLLNYNINDYHTIKTYAGKSNNSNKNNNNSSNNVGISSNNYIPQIFQNNPSNANVNNNYKYNNKLMFNYSLKNDLKLKNNKLSLDLNNYNSIEANTNRIYKYSVKSPKLTFTLSSINKSKGICNDLINNSNNNYNAITYEDSLERKPSFQNLKKNTHFFNSLSSTPFSLKKESLNKIISDNNYFDSFINKECNINNTSSTDFNYKENFENLKKRMSDLIENLFKIIEIQNNQKK